MSDSVLSVHDYFTSIKVNRNRYNIIKSIHENSTHQYNELISLIAPKIMLKAALRFEEAQNLQILNRQRLTNIAVIDSFKAFTLICENITPTLFSYSGLYLIVLLNGAIAEIDQIFDVFWKIGIFNVNVLYENDDNESVSTFTFKPFKPGCQCGDTDPVKINELDGKTMKWETDVFFPKKTRNLHKCHLKIATYESKPGMMIRNNSAGNLTLYGFEGEFLNEIANLLNFSMDITLISDKSGVGFLFENGTAKGLIKKTINAEIDIVASLLSLQYLRTIYLSVTVPYFNDKVILLVPPLSPLPPFMKLLHPFKMHVWSMIAGTFSISFSVIFVIKIMPVKFYNFVIGKNVRTPYLNTLIGMIGMSQDKLPSGTFARYLLTLYLIFSMIIRSIYQGGLYNVLKSSIYSRERTTIDEYYDDNFNFHMHEGFEDKLKYFKFYNR